MAVLGAPPAYAKSAPVTGNSTAAAVTFADGAKMAALAGKRVALKVELAAGCKLYSLRGDFSWAP